MSTCKRDVVARDRDETETFEKYVSRPSRDRDVETETTTLVTGPVVRASLLMETNVLPTTPHRQEFKPSGNIYVYI